MVGDTPKQQQGPPPDRFAERVVMFDNTKMERAVHEHRDEINAILDRVRPWCDSVLGAQVWFQSEPLAALGQRTAFSLVLDGRASDVLAYLDTIEVNGYA
jgi:hypothetical protein